MLKKVLAKLNLNARERIEICEATYSETVPAAEAQVLEHEVFKAISQWHHFAILSLSRLKDQSSDSNWIAKRLGISRIQAKDALDRLENLGLITCKKGKLVLTSKKLISAGNDETDVAVRAYHRDILEKTLTSLEMDSVESRDISSMGLTIKRSDLIKAKEFIKRFRRKFIQVFETEPGESVYQLNIQLIPISKQENT